MDRKRFIKMVSAGVTCGGLFPMLPGCLTYRYADGRIENEALVVSKSVFGEDDFVLIRNPRHKSPIYLRKSPDGDLAALLLECTHKQCTVNPRPERLACPCHGSRYDLDGKVTEGPARENLYRYKVKTKNDEIFIELPN